MQLILLIQENEHWTVTFLIGKKQRAESHWNDIQTEIAEKPEIRQFWKKHYGHVIQ